MQVGVDWTVEKSSARLVMVSEEGVYAKFAGDKLGNEKAMD